MPGCSSDGRSHVFSDLIWSIADPLRGPYRPPQYERVMLPMTVLRCFDFVLAPTKGKVVAEYEAEIALRGGEAGPRAGEIVALEWADVDLERRQIRVRHSDWCGELTAPKNGAFGSSG